MHSQISPYKYTEKRALINIKWAFIQKKIQIDVPSQEKVFLWDIALIVIGLLLQHLSAFDSGKYHSAAREKTC